MDNQHRIHKKRKNKTKNNTIYLGYHYAQTSTNSVNKTRVLLQTTGGKDELYAL